MKKSLIAISMIFAIAFLPMMVSKASLPYPVIDPGKGGGTPPLPPSELTRSEYVFVSIDDLTLGVSVMSRISGDTQTIIVTISGNIYPTARYFSSVLIRPTDYPSHRLNWPATNYFYLQYPNYFKQNYLLDAKVENEEIEITNLLYDGYFSFTFTLTPGDSDIIETCRIYVMMSVTDPGRCDWENVYLNCVD